MTAPATRTAPMTVQEYVDRFVAEAPPLTREQLDRVAALLRPALAKGGGDRG